MRTVKALLFASLLLAAHAVAAPVNRPTLAQALAVPNVVAVVGNGSTWDAYRLADLASLPAHAKVTPLTPAEALAAFDTAEPLLADVRDQAQGAFDANQTYLAIGTPTNAQVTAQVRALTQQMNRVIRALGRVIVLRVQP